MNKEQVIKQWLLKISYHCVRKFRTRKAELNRNHKP